MKPTPRKLLGYALVRVCRRAHVREVWTTDGWRRRARAREAHLWPLSGDVLRAAFLSTLTHPTINVIYLNLLGYTLYVAPVYAQPSGRITAPVSAWEMIR